MPQIHKLLAATAFVIEFTICNQLYAQPLEKHYRNDEAHFELSYPADLKLDDHDLADALMLLFPDHDNANIHVTIFGNRPANPCYFRTGHDGEDVTINAIPFKRESWVDGGMESYSDMKTYTTAHDGQCYQIALQIRHSKYEDDPANNYNHAPLEAILDHIVSTFKFTD